MFPILRFMRRRYTSAKGLLRSSLVAAGALAFAAACTSSTGKVARSDRTDKHQATTATTAAVNANPVTPVWLCRPGETPDPCVSDLDAEVVTASGSRTTQPASPAPDSPFDCFYVYPTVSTEPGPNADLTVQPAEVAAAEDQASRFSTVCRVWAPMYRQVTLDALFTGGLRSIDTAYASLESDWQYYLQHYNDGRPVIFIGHSQGAAMLIRLLGEQVDPNPSVRDRLVVAIVAGGNLQVPAGKTVGATFKSIPLCTSTTHAGCAIAYSTFASEPPTGALFGRPGIGVSLMSLQVQSAGQQVACVNPADVGGDGGALFPYFLRSAKTHWVTYPGLYTASCEAADGATWLQINTTKVPGDTRPVVSASLGPTWGYHAVDVNLALGNLVSDVSAFESAYGH